MTRRLAGRGGVIRVSQQRYTRFILMNFLCRFPLWQYLQQPLFDEESPAILNPRHYWQLYSAHYLERCFDNNWPERCWQVDYYCFQQQYQSFVERHYFEESHLAWLEHCWHLRYFRYGLTR